MVPLTRALSMVERQGNTGFQVITFTIIAVLREGRGLGWLEHAD